MKYVIILGDGMADEPIPSLTGKTPLQAADTPTFDYMAPRSRMGMLKTVPEGFHPGSEVANMSVLGYDLPTTFEGRGSLEAASIGVDIERGEMAMRCNLICVENGKIKNHSAGHISDEEAAELIAFLSEKLGSDTVRFYPGISYRHLLKIRGGDKRIDCTPPHDVPGTPFREVLVKADVPEAEETADLINDLILKSQVLLANHPVNKKRIAEGKDPANSIWPWSPGYRPSMPTLAAVEGATGLWNTNYEGKAKAAIEAMKNNDFVFVHVEASDEAGHEGDVALKTRTIEYLDQRLCKPIVEAADRMQESVRIGVLPDHPTPCRLKTHTSNPVPFMIYSKGENADGISEYNECSAINGSLGTLETDGFIKELLK